MTNINLHIAYVLKNVIINTVMKGESMKTLTIPVSGGGGAA